jgi:hypothetical protein
MEPRVQAVEEQIDKIGSSDLFFARVTESCVEFVMPTCEIGVIVSK